MSDKHLEEIKHNILTISDMEVNDDQQTSKVLLQKTRQSVDKLEHLVGDRYSLGNKQLWVIAGPIGSGKSSILSHLIDNPDFPEFFFGVNQLSDVMPIDYVVDETEKLSIMETQCSWYEGLVLRMGASLAIETSSCKKTFIEKAKSMGYTVKVIFIGNEEVETNLHRVKKRFENGGPEVAEGKVKSNFTSTMEGLSELWSLADIVEVYDNSRKTFRICALKYFDSLFLFNKETRPAWVYSYLVIASILVSQDLEKVIDYGILGTDEFFTKGIPVRA